MPGSPVLSPAIVLHTLRYGETSRVVRLATPAFGVISAIAKGALRPRSRFGASLQLLSEGQAHLLLSKSSDLHLLVAFDLASPHHALGRNLARFAAASALAEIAGHFVPPAANQAVYASLRDDLALIEAAPEDAIAVVTLRAMWRFMAELGLGPTLDACARDGAPLAPPEESVALSLRDGGFLCAACARGGASTRLAPEDRADLVALAAPGGELPLLARRQVLAHRRLVLRWIREHLGEGPMPALEGWATAESA